ncbi:hypothetical protein F7725_028137 [Dissostichus mawsoni]|uniref:Uncharacterized protein n=1 Tax=Dissostichus mawsoni TaxID=36200 RepID=A0A7J5XFW5_DISMA|nr:hypothetical protein F7725_028137 [Dissostichus mawsoni]
MASVPLSYAWLHLDGSLEVIYNKCFVSTDRHQRIGFFSVGVWVEPSWDGDGTLIKEVSSKHVDQGSEQQGTSSLDPVLGQFHFLQDVIFQPCPAVLRSIH